MRKCLSFILVFALLSCAAAAFADGAGTPIGSDEELWEAILGYREQGASAFELRFTQEYYDHIKESRFSTFQVQMMLAGVNGEVSFRYGLSDPVLKPENVVWGVPNTAQCSTEREIEDAVAKFLADGFGCFRIIVVGEELHTKVDGENLLYAYAAQNGVTDMELRYTFREPYIFTFSQIVRATVPVVVAKDSGEFAQALAYMAEQGEKAFRIVATPELYALMQDDDDALRNRLEACSPMEDRGCRENRYYRSFDYTDVTYTSSPRIYCDSEEDMVQAIRQMGASGISDFRLVLSKELFGTIYRDYRLTDRLNELHVEAGLGNYSLEYSYRTYWLHYMNAEIHSDAVKLSSVREAMDYVTQRASEGADDIALFCTPEVYTVLIGNINPYINVRVGMSPIFDVTAQAGIFDFELFFSGSTHLIELQNCEYYPGTRIVKALRDGDTSGLTQREKAAMEAAQDMAARCAKDDPLETARAIHDELCAMVTYNTDETQDEGDTAIGCLLNGVADCDGYADAFYLVGTLAGLNVRYQHGDSYDRWSSLFEDITHMWNLLEIDGTWRLVDVTWDDGESAPTYTWFDLGEDRASRMHIWNAETSVPLLPETDLSTRPANEYPVTCKEDVFAAAKDAEANGYAAFVVIFDTEEHADRYETLNAVRDAVSGPFTYSWNDHMLTMTVER